MRIALRKEQADLGRCGSGERVGLPLQVLVPNSRPDASGSAGLDRQEIRRFTEA